MPRANARSTEAGSASAQHPAPRRNGQLRAELTIENDPSALPGDLEPMVKAVAEALARSVALPAPRAVASVVLTSDAEVKVLNKTWRQLDKPTNVLSFPSSKFERKQSIDGETFLGDVILAEETLLREAAEQGIPPDHHFRHLVLHGLLHLLGYDHETDGEADAMEQLETSILAGLGIADPHAEPLSR